MLSFAYRLATDVAAPVIGLYLYKRRLSGREDSARFGERFGMTTQVRPTGRLVWCHAASVGEAISLLALIEKLRELYPQTNILITTGTVSSARILQKRLPPGVVHQYVPVDRMVYVRRFLDHWRPDLVLWVESELWPNMLAELRARKTPAVLLNGRMSEQSFRRWRLVKGWAQEILQTFSVCFAQTDLERERFTELGAKDARNVGNLKYAAQPLPCDGQALAHLRKVIAARPCWGMMSTHKGEEEIALAVHRRLMAKWPDLLTVIVPRHTERGGEVAAFLQNSGVASARRSRGDALIPETGIYLADTLGELGLFYRLCPIAAVGGSFAKLGGHNPIEPAQLETAIILGPSMYDFSEIVRDFLDRRAARQVKDTAELTSTIERWLEAPDERICYTQAAKLLTDQKQSSLNEIVTTLKPWLEAKA